MSIPACCATFSSGWSARKATARSGLASFSANATTISASPAPIRSAQTARATSSTDASRTRPSSKSALQRPGPASSTKNARPRTSTRCKTGHTPNSSIPSGPAATSSHAAARACHPLAIPIATRTITAPRRMPATSAWRSIAGDR